MLSALGCRNGLTNFTIHAEVDSLCYPVILSETTSLAFKMTKPLVDWRMD